MWAGPLPPRPLSWHVNCHLLPVLTWSSFQVPLCPHLLCWILVHRNASFDLSYLFKDLSSKYSNILRILDVKGRILDVKGVNI